MAMIGSSIALSIIADPVCGTDRVYRCWAWSTGSIVINPNTEAQREKSVLDLTVSGTRDAVMMVEAGANEDYRKGNAGSAILLAHMKKSRRSLRSSMTIVSEIGKAQDRGRASVKVDEDV